MDVFEHGHDLHGLPQAHLIGKDAGPPLVPALWVWVWVWVYVGVWVSFWV